MAPTETRRVRNSIEQRRGPRGIRYRARFKLPASGRTIVGKWQKRKADAVLDLRQLRAKIDHAPRRILTLGEAMQTVVEDARQRGLRSRTVTSLLSHFKILAQTSWFRPKRLLSRLTPEDIKEFVAARRAGKTGAKSDAGEDLGPVSMATVFANLRALSTVVTLGIDTGCLAMNPIRAARIKRPDTPHVDWFTRDEIEELLETMRAYNGGSRLQSARDADLVELLALTGLRIREATDLTVGDVSLKRSLISVRDGKRGNRVIGIGAELREILERFLDGRHRFPARRGDQLLPVNYRGLQTLLRRWKVRLKEPRIHAHAFRHSYLTEVARITGDQFQVMRAGGLRSAQMAMRYVHLAGIAAADSVTKISYRKHAAPPSGAREQASP